MFFALLCALPPSGGQKIKRCRCGDEQVPVQQRFHPKVIRSSLGVGVYIDRAVVYGSCGGVILFFFLVEGVVLAAKQVLTTANYGIAIVSGTRW